MSLIYSTLSRQLPIYLRSASQLRSAFPLTRFAHQNGQISQPCPPEILGPPSSASTSHLDVLESRSASALKETPQPSDSTGSERSHQYAEGSKGTASGSTGEPADGSGKPSFEKLQAVHNILTDSVSFSCKGSTFQMCHKLLNLFNKPMNYKIYHPDLLFIDNIRGKRTNGIYPYIQQVALLRTVGHLKFAVVKFVILNTDISKEEARITVRWRIIGISAIQVMLQFWKFKLWDWKGVMEKQGTWYDGVSYFDVDANGLIYRHIAEKMMVDKDKEVVKPPKTVLAATLGFLATLLPGASSLSCSKSSNSSKDNSNKVNQPPPI